MVEIFEVLTGLSEKLQKENVNANFVIGGDWLKNLKGKLTNITIASHLSRKVLANVLMSNSKLLITIFPPRFEISIDRKMHKEKLEMLRLILEHKITIFSLSEEWLYTLNGGFDFFLSSLNFAYTSLFTQKIIKDNETTSKILGRIGEVKDKQKFKDLVDLTLRNVEWAITHHGGFDIPIQKIVILLDLIEEEMICQLNSSLGIDAIVVGDISHQVKQAIILSKVPIICLGRSNLENALLAKVQRLLMELLTIDLPELVLVKEEPFGKVYQRE